MIDRLFGLMFGVARGFLLVVIPYMFWFGFLYPQTAETHEWIRNAHSKPYIEATGVSVRAFLERIVPEDLSFGRGDSGDSERQR